MNDQPILRAILGPHGNKLIGSGDRVADQQYRKAFIKAYNEANKIVFEGDQQAVLVIGQDEWPMPIPLVKLPCRVAFPTPHRVKGNPHPPHRPQRTGLGPSVPCHRGRRARVCDTSM